MIRAFASLLVSVVLHAAALAQPPATRLALVGPDDVRPVRLVVEIDGEPAEKYWAEGVAALVAYFDRDGNGHLDRTEAARLPAPVVLRQLSWGHVTPTPGGEPRWEDLDADRDGKAGTREVEAYYRRRGAGGVIVAHARPTAPRKLSDALWARLDADGDGKLTEAELANAPRALRPLDTNGDELVSAAELCPGMRYPGGSPATVIPPTAEPTPDPKGSRPPLVPLDGEGEADNVRETWTIRIGARGDEKLPLERKSERGEGPAFVGPGGQWHLQSDLAARATDEVAAAAKAARRTFDESDGDSDGALDAVERERPAALGLKFLLPFADRNGDGNLSRGELDAWLGLQAKLARGCVTVGVTDFGSGLFETLDADRDGVLSARELRSAVARVRTTGAMKGGAVDRSQIPRHALVTVGRGRPSPNLVPQPRSGPEWFRAMDRNRDGDVSAAEFLGPPEEFKRLDADGDGFIGLDEANRAESGK